MAANLDDIELAFFTALSALKGAPPSLTQPFRVVDRWAGEVSQERGVEENTLNAVPAALLAFEQSIPEGRDGALVETGSHLIEVVERHLFLVYVVVGDTRSDSAAIKGGSAVPGILRCARLVKEALAGLVIPGLFDGDVVRLEGHRPWLIERGVQHTHILRFSARAELPASSVTTPGDPFVLDARANAPEPDTDAATVNLSTARAPRA